MVDLAPVLWDRRKYLELLADALSSPPAPLATEWGDPVESEAARGKMSRPPATPRKDRSA